MLLLKNINSGCCKKNKVVSLENKNDLTEMCMEVECFIHIYLAILISFFWLTSTNFFKV